MTESNDIKKWIESRIRPEEIEKYIGSEGVFLNSAKIEQTLKDAAEPDAARVRELISKSLSVEPLSLEETALLLKVRDEDLWAEMMEAAGQVKRNVYDNRIVTFAPLYLSSSCVNDCLYCGFRCSNSRSGRRKLSIADVIKETEVLAGKIGHKRLIVVYGEHPDSDIDYIASTMEAIMSVRVKTRRGIGQIRRCNVNAAPLQIDELKRLHEIGIGTFQVFQETYHRPTYEKVHPQNTLKGDYLWRLYCMHRAMEAGVDDVGLGVLFGLYDWRFEVLGLVSHAIELESRYGVGPHTISFPRLEPADNAPLTQNPEYSVSDDDFKKLVTVLRLAVPYTGMIITAREDAKIKKEVLALGCTQTDASSRIGIGGYASSEENQDMKDQQFLLGDEVSLDDLVYDLAKSGYITSFCTAGYRCGRTGECIMDMLKTGKEGGLCKLNAVITFREWLDDFASEATQIEGEKIIAKEIEEIRQTMPEIYDTFMEYYQNTKKGQRDLYF